MKPHDTEQLSEVSPYPVTKEHIVEYLHLAVTRHFERLDMRPASWSEFLSVGHYGDEIVVVLAMHWLERKKLIERGNNFGSVAMAIETKGDLAGNIGNADFIWSNVYTTIFRNVQRILYANIESGTFLQHTVNNTVFINLGHQRGHESSAP